MSYTIKGKIFSSQEALEKFKIDFQDLIEEFKNH
jgi:hypothetical protein